MSHSLTALVDGSMGKAVERYMYDPYGQVEVRSGAADADGEVAEWSPDAEGESDWANDRLFAGYALDAESGLYAVRHRTYHPTLGRWLQRDPAGYADGANLYAYCSAAPATLTDPLGLCGGDGLAPWPGEGLAVALVSGGPGSPGNMPRPPRWQPDWSFRPNKNWDPMHPKQRPGSYRSADGTKHQWHPLPNEHNEEHWDVDEPGQPRYRLRPDGSRLVDDGPARSPKPVTDPRPPQQPSAPPSAKPVPCGWGSRLLQCAKAVGAFLAKYATRLAPPFVLMPNPAQELHSPRASDPIGPRGEA